MRTIPMKLRFLAVLFLFSAVTAMAADPGPITRNESVSLGFQWPSWFSNTGNLQNQVNQLNRMLGHVRWQFTRYHSNRALQQDYFRIKHEAERLNARYKTGKYDQKQMRSDIQGLRARLQEIEVRLKVKKADLYVWK